MGEDGYWTAGFFRYPLFLRRKYLRALERSMKGDIVWEAQT
jgi:hypothetical protein